MRSAVDAADDRAHHGALNIGAATIITERINEKLAPAVVVGACAHGLAVVRSLARQGIEVHILEANPDLPGLQTRYARAHLCNDINGAGLTTGLRVLGEALNTGSSTNVPTLFVTNDNMVRQVADGWEDLRRLYRLSWSHCAAEVKQLLLKTTHEQHAQRVGLNYPCTSVVGSDADLVTVSGKVGFPAIVKPARPLSSFKARRVDSKADLQGLVKHYAGDLPFVVQTWIPGSDERISFCALYLDHGRVLARFDGRKLRSWPMGHTTVAEPSPDDHVFEQTRQFFAPLAMSGPVSLELKRDPNGRLWVIEPTVGRTDFWLGLCTANGVNLPYVEYCHQVGLCIPRSIPTSSRVWLHTERDPAALPWYLARCVARATIPIWFDFPYLDADDPQPFRHAVKVSVTHSLRRVLRRSPTGR